MCVRVHASPPVQWSAEANAKKNISIVYKTTATRNWYCPQLLVHLKPWGELDKIGHRQSLRRKHGDFAKRMREGEIEEESEGEEEGEEEIEEQSEEEGEEGDWEGVGGLK